LPGSPLTEIILQGPTEHEYLLQALWNTPSCTG